MFKLFLSRSGLLRRQDFWIAIGSFALLIFAFERGMPLIGPGMMTFWTGLIFFSFLIYSFYQVCKKRLRDMGHSARPFWIFLFCLFILFVGLALFFGWGEHLTTLFEYRAQFDKGEITEAQMIELIRVEEPLMTQKLADARKKAEIILTLPAIVFLAWLALTPGTPPSKQRSNSAE